MGSNSAKPYADRKNCEQSIWISQEKKCVSFHCVTEYRKIEMSNSDEMWKMIRHLIDTGYKVE